MRNSSLTKHCLFCFVLFCFVLLFFSLGAQAIVSVMVGQAINDVIGREGGDAADDDIERDETQRRIELAIALCLVVGIIQVKCLFVRNCFLHNNHHIVIK